MRRWLKIYAAIALAAAAFSLGVIAQRGQVFPATVIDRTLRWVQTASGRTVLAKDGGLWGRRRSPADQVDALMALPYVSGSQPAASNVGVRVHDPERTAPGVNLYTSAHAPEAMLIDREGNLLHRWEMDPDEVWPDLAELDEGPPYRYFRRVRLLPDGGLLVIYEYRGVVRIDADSNLLWAHQGWNHHDLDVDDRGRIYVLGRERREVPRLRKQGYVWDENITILDEQGKLVDRISILECLENSRYSPLLDIARLRGAEDAFHMNTVAWLDGSLAGRSELFERGRLLVSIRNLNTVAIVDPESREVVWALTGGWLQQHEPVLLPSGRMLLFDNRTGTDRSRVIELDPFTQELFWQYAGSDATPFYSSLQGSAQRLPNGNTLITESDFGRVFEVTPEGSIVWEFVNPHTTGAGDTLIAVVPEMIRLEPEFPIESLLASR